jgi:hypothetical protein
MDGSSMKFEVEKQYKIAKGGIQIVLTESELRQLLLSDEIMRVITKLITPAGVAVASNDVRQTTLAPPPDLVPKFPKGFRSLGKMESDPTSPYRSIFAYAINDEGEYGFRSLSSKGWSAFNRLGKLDDPNTIIGEFFSVVKEKVPFKQDWIKHDFFELPLKHIREGRRMKAVIDVLEIEGYLTKKPSEARGNRMAYQKTEKFGLEAVGKKDGKPSSTSSP